MTDDERQEALASVSYLELLLEIWRRGLIVVEDEDGKVKLVKWEGKA